MDTHGSIWIHMGPNGSIWVHMDPYESIWTHMSPYRSIWVQMDPYGSMASIGSIWVQMHPYRSIWITVTEQHSDVSLQTKMTAHIRDLIFPCGSINISRRGTPSLRRQLLPGQGSGLHLSQPAPDRLLRGSRVVIQNNHEKRSDAQIRGGSQ